MTVALWTSKMDNCFSTVVVKKGKHCTITAFLPLLKGNVQNLQQRDIKISFLIHNLLNEHDCSLVVRQPTPFLAQKSLHANDIKKLAEKIHNAGKNGTRTSFGPFFPYKFHRISSYSSPNSAQWLSVWIIIKSCSFCS